MIIFSHRGNTKGPTGYENHRSQITAALQAGFHVEVDVRYIDKQWYLGHDAPISSIAPSLLLDPRIVCHAKSLDALYALLDLGAHCFWHQEDSVTLTSLNLVWAHPDSPKLSTFRTCSRMVLMHPERYSVPTRGVLRCLHRFPNRL
jgi:hypothetical protein